MTIGNVNIVNLAIIGKTFAIVGDKLLWRSLNAIEKMFYYNTSCSFRS